ncbi:(Fe-S)-binding protein [Sulfolobus acidocaldarius]|nr:(Fe-S)-binding protein [Sulfolobus acidocaldarius]AGE70178.1 hypothetical protein SacN8_00985 [Sulfolobus acidocaldarius N8]AGE72453.1 hypothetical protein SacRon12I_00985 [Sulfolobus acidocaldarius Ron12/I]ALU29412.1 Fe-S oxidoreductase [Sulfolobus acidocaldarius]ALU32140.1 Fe-S oxidoreductase [Sulfolobus acidocaldarius]WCM34198.1 4Fe-4S dicluster domain-containing protein [Sulfolobus acidocaldarius DSM 639]
MGLEEALKCVHCGFCLESCPTYVVTRSEIHSPRGRITAVKLGIDSEGLKTCMFCRKCEIACPSGVKYSEIFVNSRKSNPLERSMLRLLEKPSSLALPLKIGMGVETSLPLEYRDQNEDLIIFPGCLTSVISRSSVEKAVKYFKGLGYNVKVINTCCGLAHSHVGENKRAMDIVQKLREEFKGKTVVSLSSNCSAFMKENGLDVYDFPEFVLSKNLPLPKVNEKVTIHYPCHAHVVGIEGYIRKMAEKLGLTIMDSDDPYFECGAGGSQIFFNKQISSDVMSRKKEKVMKSGVNTVISTNPSCTLAFIKMGLKPIHLVDLL